MKPEQATCSDALVHGRLITMSQWDGGQSFQLRDYITQRYGERGKKSTEAKGSGSEGTEPVPG